MANPEHLAILKQGVEVWNVWRRMNGIKPDLRGADLQGANLRGANLDVTYLVAADLSYADLSDVKLAYAHLNNAILNETTLRGAYLLGTDLTAAHLYKVTINGAFFDKTHLFDTNLREVDFRGAHFRKPYFSRAHFDRVLFGDADLSQIRLAFTTFSDVDLSGAKGLDSIEHEGPSTIGIDTIYKSKGNIPEIFLRGCGVPEDMIAYARSLRGKEIDFYSCFISHSAKDKRFCERLYADLQAKGVRVWYFPEDAKWGETVWSEIDRSIKVYDKLIVVCSEHSLQSGPVNREIERALNREDKEGKGILFPIRIDDYIFDTWEHERKADVLRKVVGDFSGWDKDAAKYNKAFDKLLKGLQAESGKA